MDDRTNGLVIRALQRRQGWRQSDLAARAGVSQSTISRAERGWLGDHTVIVAEVARRLERFGWDVEAEVTYSEFGERGSIDVLGLKPDARAAVVVEVKIDIASSEAVGRKVDEKARLVPKIVAIRYGWAPASIGRLLVMPESMRLRRLVDRHPVMGRMFPVGAVTVRRWLRVPAGAIAGLWFLSKYHPADCS